MSALKDTLTVLGEAQLEPGFKLPSKRAAQETCTPAEASG